MTKYICKCGRAVKKNTSADVTGNRQTDDCQGCPYRMAYGNSTWAEDRHAFVTDVKGYECQMSQGITYYTELGGCLSDKTVLSVYSLDFDFLDVVCRWIRETYPGQELSAVFSREKVRKSEYSSCGRYRMAVYPASNKAGIAAKNEFARKFFDRESRRRLDLTPEQEKDKILADIAAGKAAAQKQEDTPMEIRQYKTDTGMIYAVRKQSPGKYRIMCKYDKNRFGWAIATAPEFSAECNSAESLQEVLDAYAQRRGWEEVDKPNPCDGCRCKTCADTSCLQAHCGGSDHGFACIQEDGCYTPESCTSTAAPDASVLPGDVFKAPNGTLYKIADKLIGKQRCWHTVRFDPSTCEWLAVNSTVYDNLENTLGEFAAWIRTENLKPVARNGAAATAAAEEPASPPAEPAQANTTAEPAAAGSEPEERALAENPVTYDLSAPGSFDYSGLDAQTVADLHLAEREYTSGKRMAEMGLRRMADGVAIAHDTLCGSCDNLSQLKHGNRGEQTFGAWCDSVGINRKAAERLLQVSKLFDSSSPRQQKALEELSPSLLYAAAKPSAPEELVQAVKSGDITTHKQYQDLLAQLKAKSDELAAVKAEADRRAEKAQAEIDAMQGHARSMESDLVEMQQQVGIANTRAADAEQRRRIADNERKASEECANRAERRAADAEQKATRFEQLKDAALDEVKQAQARLEAERSDSLRAAAELQQRIRELEARPVEVVSVDPDEVARMAEEKAQAIAAQRSAESTRDRDALQERIEELEELLDDAAQDQIANTQALAVQAVEACDSLMESLFGKILFLPDKEYIPAKRIVESFYAKLGWVLDNNDWPDKDDWALNHSGDESDDEPDEEEAEEDE